MNFLKSTENDMLTLKANNLQVAHLHTDVAFAIHPNFRSHTGYTYYSEKAVLQQQARNRL